jgi:hypothetical protein
MDAWAWVKEHIESEADRPQVLRIDPSHVLKKRAKQVPLEANNGYFRLVVADMWLAHDVEWGKTVHPAVQSLVRIKAAGTEQTIPSIAGPDTFQVETKDRRGVAVRNQFMTQPIPFRGGTVAIQVALLRVQGQDNLKTLLNVLSGFASLVAAPPLSTALQVADKVNDGLGQMLGLGVAQIHAGLQDTFTGKGQANELQPGYLALIRSGRVKVGADDLWIGADGDLRTGPRGSDQFTASDYVVLLLESSPRRDDWTEFPAIGLPYRKARERAAVGDLKTAKGFIDNAVSAVMLSDDIVDRQKDSIVKTLRGVVGTTDVAHDRRALDRQFAFRVGMVGENPMFRVSPHAAARLGVSPNVATRLPAGRGLVRLEATRFRRLP